MASKGRTRTYDLDGHVVECTNVDRVVFPDDGITKGDVIDYYRDLAGAIVPELRDRPLTIERYTKGLAGGRDQLVDFAPPRIGQKFVCHERDVAYSPA